MELAIETQGLTKRFSKHTVVSGLTLKVPHKCVYGFVGPNGAGKTTTLRLLLGLMRPSAGAICLNGIDLRRDRISALSKVGALIEASSLYDHLSGSANLNLHRTVLGLPKSELGRVLNIVGLEESLSLPVRQYSLGMRQRLALARALMGETRLLILDEPMNGLDPGGIITMRNLIKTIPERSGATVFMSSHLLSEMELTADYVGLIADGQLIIQEKMDSLLDGRRFLVIHVDNPNAAVDALRELDLEVDRVVGSVLNVPIKPQEDPTVFSAQLNKKLNQLGIGVSKIEVSKLALEDVYKSALSRQND